MQRSANFTKLTAFCRFGRTLLTNVSTDCHVNTFIYHLETGGLANLPDVFVQIISFPKSVLWIWIGDSKADLANLSLAIKSHNVEKPKLNDIHTTTGKLATDDSIFNVSKPFFFF